MIIVTILVMIDHHDPKVRAGAWVDSVRLRHGKTWGSVHGGWIGVRSQVQRCARWVWWGSHHPPPAAWGHRGRGGHLVQSQDQDQVSLKVAGKTDGRLVTQLQIRTKAGAILGPVGAGAGQVISSDQMTN